MDPNLILLNQNEILRVRFQGAANGARAGGSIQSSSSVQQAGFIVWAREQHSSVAEDRVFTTFGGTAGSRALPKSRFNPLQD